MILMEENKKTKIELSDIVKDALMACEGSFGGLLIVGGSLEDASALRNSFQQSSDSKYPMVYRTAKEHESYRQERKFDGKLFYLVNLDQIQLTNETALGK
jgi:hypothetical protein